MSVFNFELLKVPFASGAILSEIEPFPDYVRGLGIAFEQTDGKPEMKGLNGLFNAITASMLSLRQRGISEWVTGFDYPVGAFSVESGKLYQAKTLNTSKQPSISQSDWTLWASVSDITVNANGNIKKTNSANGAFELKVEDANTTTKGAARFATATEVANKANVMAAVTPKNIQDMFMGGFSENDSVTLPSGHILKWGFIQNVSYLEIRNISFPVGNFPNACLNLQINSFSSAFSGVVENTISLKENPTKSGFSVQNVWSGDTSGSFSSANAYWFAIGY